MRTPTPHRIAHSRRDRAETGIDLDHSHTTRLLGATARCLHTHIINPQSSQRSR